LEKSRFRICERRPSIPGTVVDAVADRVGSAWSRPGERGAYFGRARRPALHRRAPTGAVRSGAARLARRRTVGASPQSARGPRRFASARNVGPWRTERARRVRRDETGGNFSCLQTLEKSRNAIGISLRSRAPERRPGPPPPRSTRRVSRSRRRSRAPPGVSGHVGRSRVRRVQFHEGGKFSCGTLATN
jgi:hypothetical protein